MVRNMRPFLYFYKMPKVQVYREPEFEVLYEPPEGTTLIICIGGRGGKKTYEVSKFAAFSSTKRKKRIVIVRDEKALIKETILNEIWSRYDTANAHGILDQYFVKNEHELKDRLSGKTLVYTKGFKATNNTKKANLKGASDIDIAIIEEAEDINDPSDFNTFVDSLRKEGCLIIVMLNTPDIGHFLLKRYFNMEPAYDDRPGSATFGKQLDGYFKITPKNLPGFVCVQTNYDDNPYLPAHVIYNYEQYGNPNSETYDEHYYWTQIRGYASAGRKGQIFTKVKSIKLKDYLALPLKEVFGQDFGSGAPAAFGGAKFEKNRVYARLINYKPMDALSLAKMYCSLGLTKSDKIICDHAGKEDIAQLKAGWKKLDEEVYKQFPQLRYGFYAEPCGPKDVEAHIRFMTGLEIYIVEECGEAWEEVYKYCYDTDRFGNYTNYPIDDFNHFWDQLRYVVMEHYVGKGGGAKKLY